MGEILQAGIHEIQKGGKRIGLHTAFAAAQAGEIQQTCGGEHLQRQSIFRAGEASVALSGQVLDVGNQLANWKVLGFGVGLVHDKQVRDRSVGRPSGSGPGTVGHIQMRLQGASGFAANLGQADTDQAGMLYGKLHPPPHVHEAPSGPRGMFNVFFLK
ncbi:hypothetical protein [Desulfosarcina sp.]|uniref:hypothetical protein n=1 Tax=Desulfosarcina sp. TaxID=2027861 RepID=UPI0029AC7BC4|nr:hypothetical protein [Desulfosarcina sp.]MDX2451295.1 hypothetical protein [Desulfosarcina sp.]MDX2489118.1 hypothetical protein [Desulfosarcina sp.]